MESGSREPLWLAMALSYAWMASLGAAAFSSDKAVKEAARSARFRLGVDVFHLCLERRRGGVCSLLFPSGLGMAAKSVVQSAHEGRGTRCPRFHGDDAIDIHIGAPVSNLEVRPPAAVPLLHRRRPDSCRPAVFAAPRPHARPHLIERNRLHFGLVRVYPTRLPRPRWKIRPGWLALRALRVHYPAGQKGFF